MSREIARALLSRGKRGGGRTWAGLAVRAREAMGFRCDDLQQ